MSLYTQLLKIFKHFRIFTKVYDFDCKTVGLCSPCLLKITMMKSVIVDYSRKCYTFYQDDMVFLTTTSCPTIHK